MLYNVDFLIAGLMLLLVQFVYIRLQYHENETVSVLRLKRLMVFLFITDLLDVITSFTISYENLFPLWVNYLLNTAFFEFEVVCIYMFPIYVRGVIDGDVIKKTLIERINSILLGVYAVICATTPFSHLIFYLDSEGKYQKGILYYAIYALPLYFLAYSFITLIYNRKMFSRKRFITVIGFIICAILGPVIQVLFMPNILIDYFMLSIASLIALTGLETPDFLKLEKTLKELEESKNIIEKAKKRDEDQARIVRSMTRSAAWRIRMDENRNFLEIFWSDEFFWMLGYDRSEIEESRNLWDESLHPDEHDVIMEAFMKGFSGIGDYDEIYRLRSKDGEYKWYRGTGELSKDIDGNGYVYRGIIQDINDEKIKEDLMYEKTQALEQLERSQAELEKAVERAEAADRAKSDFLANMSHEIRTPINAVLGMNELIARESEEDNIQEYSANVADAGQALLSLINDILDFSKIEAGRMELAPADYELSTLIREVNNMILVRCSDKGLSFNVSNNPDTPNGLYGDEVRLRQILINVLNNAVKYTDAGSVTLNVDYENIDDNNIELIFKIKDTGIGIKEEDLPALFESFKRIDLEKNRKREGTGLGLSITKSFVELMNGNIDVSSVYGQGTEFVVRIPQLVKNKVAISTLGSSSNKAKKNKYEASFEAKGAKILVVDDVKLNLKVIKGLLKQTGVEVDMAMSGMECLEKVKNTHYDVILLDHMMPEMDGIETLKRFREDSSHANQDTPVIMLTANAIIGAKDEYLEAGFADYLSKPVRTEELEDMLIRYLPEDKVNKK